MAFKHQKQFNHKIISMILGLVLSFTSFYPCNALAALIDNGNGLIYNTVTNVTWSQDTNLLGTMEASNPDLINLIVNTIHGIHDTSNGYWNGTYILSSSDFGSNGQVDWWGAQAFVGYLNSISYMGSSQWRLPVTPATQNLVSKVTDTELGQMFYNELGGSFGSKMPNGPFTNVQYRYWSSEDVSSGGGNGWYFTTLNGTLYAHGKAAKEEFAWAVSPGNIVAPVPLPASFWLFSSVLIGFIGINPRKNLD